MRNIIKLLLTLFIPLLGCQEVIKKKPNILFMVVDDLGYSDLGYTGSQLYETPNIDQLAAIGSTFENGYATCAVCSPSRASLLTGKLPARHGITDWIGAPSGVDWRNQNRHSKLLPASYESHLPHEDITLAEAFKANNYKTFFAGKWHLGGEAEGSLPTDHGFEINKGGGAKGSPYTGRYFSPFNNPYMEDYPEEKGMSLSMKLAKETNQFIEANKDSPFLAYVCFYAVHGPIQTTEAKWSKYRNKIDSIGFDENGFEMNRVLPARKYQDNPVYAGLVEQVDDAVGSMLATLKRLGLEENTIVVFTSDNGGVTSGDAYATSSPAFKGGKGYQWEGGTRVPLIIQAPGVQSGGIDVPVTGADLFPTLLDLSGLSLMQDQHQDGVSLMPLLKNKSINKRPLYWHYPHYGNQGGQPHSIIQSEGYKLIHYWEDGHNELYYLPIDVEEKDDLSNQENDKVIELEQQLMMWLKDLKSQYPEPDPLYDEAKNREVLDSYKNTLLPKLEHQRKEMLNPNWQPNADWWGSKTMDQ